MPFAIPHRYRVGDETIYVNPSTGARESVRILSVLHGDDGTPTYDVAFKLTDRISRVADGQLIPRIRFIRIDTPPLNK